jgi:hypothetical protein
VGEAGNMVRASETKSETYPLPSGMSEGESLSPIDGIKGLSQDNITKEITQRHKDTKEEFKILKSL